MTNSNLTVHNEKNFTFFLVSLFWPLIFSEIIVKMAKKNSIEIKASLLRHYFAEKCSITALVQYALTKHGVEITRQAIMKWIKIKLGFLIFAIVFFIY